MAVIMDGKSLAAKIKAQIRKQVDSLAIKPGLAVIIVGEDPASKIYVKGKINDCKECGIAGFEFVLPHTTPQSEILNLISQLNERDDVHGIICQLPLPRGIDQKSVMQAISPAKDVDSFHYENLGKTVSGNYGFLPCTPAGVMELLNHYGVEIGGKHAVVVNRSLIVGKPLAMMLLNANATVTICHSQTKNIPHMVSQADIVVTAVGRQNFITSDMVKPGAVVVDVSIIRREDGKLCGDVDFGPVSEIASHITPVPGSVGPMTRAMLMKNTLLSANGGLVG
ncbi:MAG: bifunctional methylenetetrahydrofolate dehydrogenase/methenyltetrahydrofolate cyclohydrolase FolD [Defluviitaleaceae bacterium]|nr:bifunctional methylenetetrahydrofolate dehydrogenase/methenyltetrahydrofolate cyclohydrolase FolD [Defluviitaleaceae bacterium]